MAKGLQSSLNPKRTNTLPDVYHRPQMSSGIFLNPENDNQVLSSTFSNTTNGQKIPQNRERRFREYENPNVNAMRSFETVLSTDNLTQVKRLVLALNGFKRHNKPASKEDVVWYRGRYADSLEVCNLCWRCKLPIKVKTARVTKVATQKSIFGDQPAERKTQHIRSVGGTPLSGERVKTVNNIPTTIYADIPCHYEYKVFKTENGLRYEYRYVDGSGRNIQPRKEGTKRFFVEVLTDGTETKIEHIPHSYRMQHVKCECKR